jgi:HTH-type transcriptional regulator / antitoxin HigA
MEPRIVKTAKQHRLCLAEVERLAARDPAPDSRDGVRLELLAKLVEDFEKKRFPFDKPEPGAVYRVRRAAKRKPRA